MSKPVTIDTAAQLRALRWFTNPRRSIEPIPTGVLKALIRRGLVEFHALRPRLTPFGEKVVAALGEVPDDAPFFVWCRACGKRWGSNGSAWATRDDSGVLCINCAIAHMPREEHNK